MGMHNSVGINFYFELDPAVAEEQTETRYRCSNTECSKHNKKKRMKTDNFCSTCGSKIEGVEVSIGDIMPDAFDFCEKYLKGYEIVSRVRSEGSDIPEGIWQYNLRPSFDVCTLDEDAIASGCVFDLSELNVPALIEQFMQEEPIKVFVEAFEAVYGKGYLIPRLGLISTWN